MDRRDQNPIHVARAPTHPTLLYDAECGFCRRRVRRWRRAIGDRVTFACYQAAAPAYPEIPRERLARAVHLIRPDGAVLSGAEAVFELLALRPALRPLRALYHAFPPFAAISEWAYALVARHRSLVSRLGRPWRRYRVAARRHRRSTASK